MWKVGGLIIETAAGRWIILPKLKLVKMSIFLNGPHPKIFNVEIFRICVLKGSATNFRPCYSCPKSRDGGKTRFASKIKRCHKKIRRPQFSFLTSTPNQRGVNPLELTLIPCGGQKSKIVTMLSFCDTGSHFFLETRVNFGRP